jgi:hypothetical protein
MLDHCKSIATRAKLDPNKFDLKTFRSTYATGMLRRGFDVRTVQHWMGHKSLETTMRYLAPATDVHDEVDLVTIPSVGKADPVPESPPRASPVLLGRHGRYSRAPLGSERFRVSGAGRSVNWAKYRFSGRRVAETAVA